MADVIAHNAGPAEVAAHRLCLERIGGRRVKTDAEAAAAETRLDAAEGITDENNTDVLR